MTNEETWKKIRFHAKLEALTVMLTMALGIMEMWGAFAAFALVSVLFPMWVTAVAVVAIVANTGGLEDIQ